MIRLEQTAPRIVPDPRRPGQAMALVGCWCGRFYTLTAEQIDRHRRDWTHPCPNAGAHLGRVPA